MSKPWSPAYGTLITQTLAAAATIEVDLGVESTPRTLRVYNAGANLMVFGVVGDTGKTVPGVPVGPGHVIYVNIDSNQRYLYAQSAAGTTFYANLGVGGD